ncbi:hypothetical protein CVU37_09005 [candidate division BRC1 bacterium HGW-BRC1-1]|jgi:hypothetical protein|nr:MAG: hypothetical protein CVU37_09005 [candidate division BRC1 bacterium HGW-BRC1-1]
MKKRLFLFKSLLQQLAVLATCFLTISAVSAATTETEVLKEAIAYHEKDEISVPLTPVSPVDALTSALPNLPEPNRSIVKALLQYPRDGRHKYWWPRKGESTYDGSTTDVLINGLVVMKGEPKARSFCCGLTLEVFYDILKDLPGGPQRIPDQKAADDFKKLWFCEAINANGPGDALVAAGMGRVITNPKEVLPGDFVQLWRHSKTGHSVIFVGWAYDTSGRPVGMHYWSTQEGTRGIHFNTELFGNSGKSVDLKKTGFTRLLPPDQWKPTINHP